MMIDLASVRSQTPGTVHRNHMNNAGAALMPMPVIAAVSDHFERESLIGGYEASAEAAERVEAVYASIARLIGAAKEEIAVTENATIAWQRAFFAMKFSAGDRILIAASEFAANYIAFLQMAKRTGVSIEIIPNDGDGVLDTNALIAMIDDRVRLISVTWVPANGGLINPAAEVGKIARRYGIPYLLDACQVIGQMPIDVTVIGCDILTATGRKFLRGPRGTGFLYMSRSLIQKTEPVMLDVFGAQVSGSGYQMRPDARRFETWETNYATKLGIGAASDYALTIGVSAIEKRCRMLGDRLRRGLRCIPGVEVHDLGREMAPIVSFNVEGVGPATVMHRLNTYGVNVSVSPPANTPVDAVNRNLVPFVRASPHYYNSETEVDDLIDKVSGISADY